MSPQEQQLRAELGIPPAAQQVIILDSSSHMDWDWLATFNGYYAQSGYYGFPHYPVRQIVTNATNLLDQYRNQFVHYYYSLCEVGYLMRFAADQPATFATLQGLGDLLRIVGGGITSPDNLIPHGEAIVRNFLVANTWVLENFPASPPDGSPPLDALPPLRQAWIPDDFGHDSQFPILMEAMGLQGVGLSRVPGDPQQYWTFGSNPPYSGGPSMAAYQLALGSPPGQNLGVDFIWRASDGSTTLAHFMQAGYFQGQNITGSGAVQQIQTCYSTNGPSSTTPYIYVPVMNDFKLPVPDLLQSANAWNQQKYPTNGVWAVEATFDHYVQFIAFYQNQLLTRAYTANPASNILPFQSTPYWTGFYGSRPQLKRMHQRATRALLGAEVFTSISNLLIGPDDTLQPAIDLGWLNLTPSTHHDFVTGTSANLVYQTEQITLLRNALMNGRTTRSLAMQRIASMILSDNGSQIGVVVFNQLGYERGGLVSMQPLSGFTPVSVATAQGATLGPVQIADDGRWLFSIPPAQATVPSLGYSTFMLKNSGTTPATPLACTVSSDGQTITLTNGILTAVLAGDESWGIVSITDATGNEMLSSSPPAVANVPLFYQDNGDPYKFGNETGTTFQQSSATFTTGTVTLDEGDVMITVTITGSFTIAGVTAPEEFTRVYSLALGEPFLRMKTTGAAPAGCSVFVEFPLASPVDTIVHGTPYHWDTKPAQPTYNRSHGWTPPIFEATHDFVIGYADGTALGAIYHSSLHAWAVTTGGTLLGCLLRNVLTSFGTVVDGPCDPEPHTADYTIRIPDGIAAPTEGAQLRESLAWTSPLMAEAASAVSGSVPATVPTTFSLASTSDARAIITTAKAGSVPGETTGSLVLRVYQPTNAPLAVTLTTAIGSPPPQARGITAIETAIDTQRQSQLGITTTGGAITFNAVRAITTIAID